MRDFSWPKDKPSSVPDLSLSEESKHVIRSILQSKSREGDGVIDIDELGDCLEAFGFDPDDEDIEFLKKHFDDNGDGELEVHEIMDNIDVINWHCFYGKELMDEFLRIDNDKDGFIRFPEMLRMLTTREPTPLPPLEARQLLDRLARKYDSNFDGKFSYSEFVKIYMSDELPFKNELESGTYIHKTEEEATQTSTTKPKKKRLKKRSTGLKKKPSGLSSDTQTGVKTDTARAAVKIDPKTGTNLKQDSRSANARSRSSGASGSSSSSSSRLASAASSRSNGRTTSATSEKAANGAPRSTKTRSVPKI